MGKLKGVCSKCGGEASKYRMFCKKCYKEFHVEHNRRISREQWEGHEYCYKANGYVMDKVPAHPFANKRGYVYKHRLVMEKHLGRYLTKQEVVHHKNGDKLDNRIENLVYFKTTNEHTRFHGLRGDLR